MCGIFGNFDLNKSEIFYELGKYSETRGKEASGYLVANNGSEEIKKFALPFSSKAIKRNVFKDVANNMNATFIGHTRLKTHGEEEAKENNQPVASRNLSIVHNGIIVNYKELINEFKLETKSELDSEVIGLLVEKFMIEDSLLNSIKKTLELLCGEVSIAGSFKKGDSYFLYTNTGSIYYLENNNKMIFFSSEEWITKKVKEENNLMGKIKKIEPNSGLIINSENKIVENFKQNVKGVEKNTVLLKDIEEKFRKKEILIPNVKRCSVCVLPETVPFIEFNEENECSYCKGHRKIKYEDFNELKEKLKKEKNIVVGLSGGRDSSYGLSVLKELLSANFIGVSFDWGMITDLGRRNQARVSGKLGVEHVWISADINQKRKNIKKNLTAWLSKPNLGMVPILMAGDKEWQKQLFDAAKKKNTNYIVQFQSPFEHTYFKYGFAGVRPIFAAKNNSESFLRRLNMIIRLLFFYSKNFILNPKYLNFSIFDTFKGFFSFYFKTSQILSLFEYIKYSEAEVNEHLLNKFSWECDPSTPTSWRIGDGTAPIYNYIYWISAGFTENDFFRSNQIREGQLLRDEALKMVNMENQPRFELIKNYCEMIDIDYDFVLEGLEKLKLNSMIESWSHE